MVPVKGDDALPDEIPVIQSLRRASVLIVDDEPADVRLLKRMLAGARHESVHSTTESVRALERCGESGRVIVHLVTDADGAPERVQVVDTGVGVSSGIGERRCEPPPRNSDGRRPGEPGMGLALARELACTLDFPLVPGEGPDQGATWEIRSNDR